MKRKETIIKEIRNQLAEKRIQSANALEIDDFNNALNKAYELGYEEGRQQMFPIEAVVGSEVHVPDLFHIKVWRLVRFDDYPQEEEN